MVTSPPKGPSGRVRWYAAGLATGFWSSPDELRANWLEDQRWIPQIGEDERAAGYEGWKKAVTRTLDWVQVE